MLTYTLSMNIPSEKYLLIHRIFTFFDEWLFYGVLLLLYFTESYLLMLPVFLFGSCAIMYSYKRQWAMESSRFDSKDTS